MNMNIMQGARQNCWWFSGNSASRQNALGSKLRDWAGAHRAMNKPVHLDS